MLLGKSSPDIFFGIASFLLCKCQLPFPDCQDRLYDHFKYNCLYCEYQDLVTSPIAGYKNLSSKVTSCFVHLLGKWINWLKETVWNLAYTSATAGLPHEAEPASASHWNAFISFFSRIWGWQLLRKDFERQEYIHIICMCICISFFPITPQFCPIFFDSPKLQEFNHFHRKVILTFITLKVHLIVILGLAYILFLWELKMY